MAAMGSVAMLGATRQRSPRSARLCSIAHGRPLLKYCSRCP